MEFTPAERGTLRAVLMADIVDNQQLLVSEKTDEAMRNVYRTLIKEGKALYVKLGGTCQFGSEE